MPGLALFTPTGHRSCAKPKTNCGDDFDDFELVS